MRQIRGKKAKKSDRKENKERHPLLKDGLFKRELYNIFIHMEEDYNRLLKGVCVCV